MRRRVVARRPPHRVRERPRAGAVRPGALDDGATATTGAGAAASEPGGFPSWSDTSPGWSPDGSWLVYVSTQSASGRHLHRPRRRWRKIDLTPRVRVLSTSTPRGSRLHHAPGRARGRLCRARSRTSSSAATAGTTRSPAGAGLDRLFGGVGDDGSVGRTASSTSSAAARAGHRLRRPRRPRRHRLRARPASLSRETRAARRAAPRALDPLLELRDAVVADFSPSPSSSCDCAARRRAGAR